MTPGIGLWSGWRRHVLTCLSGAVPALSFPDPALWWLAYVALVPWILLVRSSADGAEAARSGWIGGAGFLLAVHHWLLPDLHVFIVLLAALLGLLWAPWGWLVWRLLRDSPGPGRALAAVVLLPSGWLMIELVRSWQGLGGPWGLMGASQWQVRPALVLASVGGVWLVSVVVVALNVAAALLVAVPGARVSAVAALATVAASGSAIWEWAPQPGRSGTVRVAVVQPGVIDGQQARFDRGEKLTRTLVGRKDIDLVVWGESSVAFDLSGRTDLADRLGALSRSLGSDVLVNVDARRLDGHGIYKTSVLVGPQGPTGQRYDKTRLVPFGEYIPARPMLRWVTGVSAAATENRRRGSGPVVMEAGGVRLGPLVCFESAFPDMSRALTRRGARLLVTQSSTSSFQRSWAPEQHATLAALRAAETWRPVVHATLTGVSAVYDAHGHRVGRWLGTDESTVGVYDVPLATGTSPYTRYGAWVPWLAFDILGVAALGLGARAVRRPAPARR
ncbi:apolipoprotein N-acyltransferase [Wenjunlia tyrosinilytica]|uniref:Apolipoprotein N-acyltransferase n=1 Tax=Wenjunlia tyrosinilytica TaxID=1544741 RepID=A0A917ZLH3_9ACTN|nr:apolipoprotein N-acyltransferase [Wenjunlia tyrosinilytica]GGO84405.1 apolipoprotein N-acyltransferase [Wenjunlia tyrosinilytica]